MMEIGLPARTTSYRVGNAQTAPAERCNQQGGEFQPAVTGGEVRGYRRGCTRVCASHARVPTDVYDSRIPSEFGAISWSDRQRELILVLAFNTTHLPSLEI